MRADALELLQKTAVKSAGVKVIDEIGLRNETVVSIDGKLERVKHVPEAREHTVADLDSLATLINGPSFTKEEDEGSGPVLYGNASVWHLGDVVIALLDDSPGSFRDDRGEWTLKPSKKFTVLTSDGGAAKPRLHAQFVEFLVENLRDELHIAVPGLLEIIRKLKMTTNSEATGDIQHARSSMGKSIEAAVAGAGDLPETITLKVRRWADLEYFADVECLFKLDPMKGELSLRPLADELQQAENAAQAWLHQQIADEVDCPVYYGLP